MKKIISLFIVVLIISCNSDDAIIENITTVVEGQLTELRPSIITKGDKVWLFEYDEDRITTIKEYNSTISSDTLFVQYNYDDTNNIISFNRYDSNGETHPNDVATYYFFENGLLTESFLWNQCATDDHRVYSYDDQNRLIQENYTGCVPIGFQGVLMYLYDEFYTYDVNNNLVEKEFTNSTNSGAEYIEEYIYDDKNHPFKNIDARCGLFLNLPNKFSLVDGFIDYNVYGNNIFNPYLEAKSFNNNRLGILGEDVLGYSLIYNAQNYPIEMVAIDELYPPLDGQTPENIYIEYE